MAFPDVGVSVFMFCGVGVEAFVTTLAFSCLLQETNVRAHKIVKVDVNRERIRTVFLMVSLANRQLSRPLLLLPSPFAHLHRDSG